MSENNYMNEHIKCIESYINRLERNNKTRKKEIERLHSIIKEVREYLNNTIDIKDTKEIFEHFNKIEELLDKVDKENI